MALAIGTAAFTAGGSETAAFTWKDPITGAPVVLGTTPKVLAPSVTVTSGGQGAGYPYFASAAAFDTFGGSFTMANPPNCTVVCLAIG